MPAPNPKSAPQSGDILPLPAARDTPTPGKVNAAEVMAIADKYDEQGAVGMACDDNNRARLKIDPSECIFSPTRRQHLDYARVLAWRDVITNFNNAVQNVDVDQLREAIRATKSSDWVADLVLSVLTYGVSAGVIAGLKLLRTTAGASLAEFLEQDAPTEFIPQASGALKPGGPLRPEYAIPEPAKIGQLAMRVPDAAIIVPMSKALDAGKKLAKSAIAPADSSENEAHEFLMQLQVSGNEVLASLATPSTTLSDYALAAELQAAHSKDLKADKLYASITSSLHQWINGKLGRLGVEHHRMAHVGDHVASDPDGIDYTRKLVRVEHDGEPRYAVYVTESFTRATAHVGDESGRIESIVPRQLESAALAKHVSTWGANPEPYRGWNEWTREPSAEKEGQ